MALIEGVGDEVTLLFGALLVLLVLLLAWISTRTSEPPEHLFTSTTGSAPSLGTSAVHEDTPPSSTNTTSSSSASSSSVTEAQPTNASIQAGKGAATLESGEAGGDVVGNDGGGEEESSSSQRNMVVRLKFL